MIWLLIILALVWIVFAIVQDFKSREVANWLNFSLIIFALAVRLFYSVFSDNYTYILWGLFGLGVFFILGHLFYYMRLFAGGDAKLLIALGVIIPFANNWYDNVLIFFVFVIGLLLAGAIYSLIYSFVVVLLNKKEFGKEFKKQFKLNKKLVFLSLILAIGLLLVSFIPGFFLLVVASLMIFILPYLYIYTKAVEQACMVKKVDVKDLTIGDWLVEDINFKGMKIGAHWEGLSEKDLKFLQKNYRHKVLVKYGVPFTPAFLFGFLIAVLFWLRNFEVWFI